MDIVFIVLVIAGLVAYVYHRLQKSGATLYIPERFVIFDLETTGLSAGNDQIIEIGAIRVNRGSISHDAFQTLVKPTKKIPRKITDLTGITQEMVNAEGITLEAALHDFAVFVGDLRLVSFNAEFDMAFLRAGTSATAMAPFRNQVSCALKMSRRAWPGRRSFRLADLARDFNLSAESTHRALADCERALIVYAAAASKLSSVS